MELTGDSGADCVIECIGRYHEVPGREAPVRQAVQMVRPGGRVVACGLGEQGVAGSLQDAGSSRKRRPSPVVTRPDTRVCHSARSVTTGSMWRARQTGGRAARTPAANIAATGGTRIVQSPGLTS